MYYHKYGYYLTISIQFNHFIWNLERIINVSLEGIITFAVNYIIASLEMYTEY